MAALVIAGGIATAPAPYARPWSHAWYVGALCIHAHESGDFHYGPNRHGSRPWNGYYGGWQWLYSTWQKSNRLMHRHDDPQWSTPRVQLWHVYVVWKADGGWSKWPNTARACGLR